MGASILHHREGRDGRLRYPLPENIRQPGRRRMTARQVERALGFPFFCIESKMEVPARTVGAQWMCWF